MSLTLIRISDSHDIIPCVAAPCHMLWPSVTLCVCVCDLDYVNPALLFPGRAGTARSELGAVYRVDRGLSTPRLLTTRAATRQVTVPHVCTVAKSSCKLPLVVQVRLCVPVERMCVVLLAFAAVLWSPFADMSAPPFSFFLVAIPMPFVGFFSG